MCENAKKEKRPIVIAENRDFKGVWIPARLYEARDLNPNEKFILLEIYSLTKKDTRECYANNKHFADFVGLKENTIQKMLLNIENKGYIKRNYKFVENSHEIEKRTIKLTQKFFDEFINEKEASEPSSDDMENNPQGDGEKSISPMEKNPPGGGKKVGDKYSIIKYNNDLSNISSSITNINAFSLNKEKGGKNICFFSDEKEAPTLKKKSRFIPQNYTIEQLREHIAPVIRERITEMPFDGENADVLADNLLEIICRFHVAYYEKFGSRHKILSDMAYQNIADRFLFPPHEMIENGEQYEVGTYLDMMELYLNTEYNKQKKFDKKIELSISHFMSDNIRKHLVLRLFL